VVAVSGGPDSLALLLGLSELAPRHDRQLVVAHLDHGTRPEDNLNDAAFVVEIGGRLGHPVEVGIARPADRPRGANLEEWARETRYAFLARVADRHRAHTIAVGHTADDQAETLLLRLIRGAGPRGLAAMTPLARRRRLQVVRPLLAVSRSEVQSYLEESKIVARFDHSNAELTWSRNRVRHVLVPLLERRFNPGIVDTLGRTAELMAEIDQHLEARGEAILAAVEDDGDRHPDDAVRRAGAARQRTAGTTAQVTLDLARLSSYDAILQRYTLRAGLRRVGGGLRGLGYRHIDALLRLSRHGAAGHRVELPGDLVGIREGRRLTLTREQPGRAPAQGDAVRLEPFEVPLDGELTIPGTDLQIRTRIHAESSEEWPDLDTIRAAAPDRAWFDLAALRPPLTIRSRRNGDRIDAHGLDGAPKVKRLMIDAGIPRRRRHAVPVLEDREHLLWVVGVRRSRHALVDENTGKILEVSLSSPMFRAAPRSR
jgi:tRNA(Ile)-lysidine synthase